MFRPWNFRRPPTSDSIENQNNWQVLTDNSKSITQLNTDAVGNGFVTGLSASAGTITIDLFQVTYGPAVLTQVALYATNGGAATIGTTLANTGCTIKLPTPVVVQTGAASYAGITSIMGLFNTPGVVQTTIPALISNSTVNGIPTQALITWLQVATFTATIVTFNGWYIRN